MHNMLIIIDLGFRNIFGIRVLRPYISILVIVARRI
jgi:hypothetical protein